jgi:indole-3-glycerol phosphate synthase
VSLLEDILAAKRAEVASLRAHVRTAATREPVNVVEALRRRPGAPLRLIAEVKLRSPSAGNLSRVLTPGARAVAYAEAGAAMVSVLCDPRFFDGSWSDLAACRTHLDSAALDPATHGAALGDANGNAKKKSATPLLAKEFVIDERQIEEARDRGADAVLLIARIVTRARLAELAHAARSQRIEPLVEVVDEGEVESALEARAAIIGVNARDLDTLQMDAARTARVLAAIPREIVAVHLSGVRNGADVRLLARDRPDAALIGEALMRQDDPRALLAAMVRDAGD